MKIPAALRRFLPSVRQPSEPGQQSTRGFWRRAVSLAESFSSFSFARRAWSGDLLLITAVYSCVDVLSKDCAKLPLIVYRKLPGTQGRELVEEGTIVQLLRRPNGWQTLFDFIRFLVVSLCFDGNFYAAIIRNGNGDPVQLIPLFPYRVQMMLTPTGEVFYAVGRGDDFINAQLKGVPLYIPARDVLHIKMMSADSFRGMSPLEATRNAAELAGSLETYGSNLFQKGGRPSGILKIPGFIPNDKVDEIKSSWEAAVAGMNAGRVAVLEGGLEYQALGLNAVDAQYLENRKYQVEEIARVFGVPLYRIGSLERATWNNVENLSKDYVDNTLLPLLENIEAALADKLGLDEKKLIVEFDVSRLLRADTTARFEMYAKARQWGIYNANECRAREGANPVDGGDIYLAPINMTDARNIGKTPPPPEPPPESMTPQEARDLVDLVIKGMVQ